MVLQNQPSIGQVTLSLLCPASTNLCGQFTLLLIPLGLNLSITCMGLVGEFPQFSLNFLLNPSILSKRYWWRDIHLGSTGRQIDSHLVLIFGHLASYNSNPKTIFESLSLMALS